MNGDMAADRVATAARLVEAALRDLRDGQWKPALAEGEAAARILSDIPDLTREDWPPSVVDRIALVGRLGAGVREHIVAGSDAVPNRGSCLKMFEVVAIELALAAQRGGLADAQIRLVLDRMRDLTSRTAQLLREVVAMAPARLCLDDDFAALIEAANAAVDAATRDAQAYRWRPTYAEQRAADEVLTVRSGPTLGDVVFNGAEPAGTTGTLTDWAAMAQVIHDHQTLTGPTLDTPYGYLSALADLLDATVRRAAGVDQQQRDQLVATVGQTISGVEVLLAAIATGDLEA